MKDDFLNKAMLVKNKIGDVIHNEVTLIVGDAAKVFKKIYTGDYYTIVTAEDVRDFMAKFSVPDTKPLVFEDLALMTPRVQTYLLKFIEEPPMPLVILSSVDHVTPTILSRSKRIVKIPCEMPTFKMSIKEFINQIPEDPDERRKYPIYEEAFSKCPEYLYEVQGIKKFANLDKYLSMLHYGEDNS